jgi:hypothetical protein
MFTRRACVLLALLATSASAAEDTALADLNGDGQQDRIALAQSRSEVILTVQIQGLGSRTLRFPVATGAQDSFCTLPVKIRLEPLDCSPDGVFLAGCIESETAAAVVLDDNDCDAIRVYLNRESETLAWWRR